MKKISPLGPRQGAGTFDCIFNTQKYIGIKEAEAANDYVKIDFVQDESGVIYFELSYSKTPAEKTHRRLNYQHFPCGVDVLDDNMVVEDAIKILEKNEHN